MLRGTIQPTEAREVVLLSEDEARDAFRAWVQARGTQKAAAAELEVTPQHVCDVLGGRRNLSEEMAAKVGLVPSGLPWRSNAPTENEEIIAAARGQKVGKE